GMPAAGEAHPGRADHSGPRGIVDQRGAGGQVTAALVIDGDVVGVEREGELGEDAQRVGAFGELAHVVAGDVPAEPAADLVVIWWSGVSLCGSSSAISAADKNLSWRAVPSSVRRIAQSGHSWSGSRAARTPARSGWPGGRGTGGRGAGSVGAYLSRSGGRSHGSRMRAIRVRSAWLAPRQDSGTAGGTVPGGMRVTRLASGS